MYEKLKARLKQEEGLRQKVYLDSRGFPTVGYGHLLRDLIAIAYAMKYLGRSDAPIFQIEQCDRWFDEDLAVAVAIFNRLFGMDKLSPGVEINEVRRDALIEMAFNLGEGNLMGFRRMVKAVRKGNWQEVWTEANDSKWDKQLPERADEIEEMLLSGRYL